MSDKRKVLKVKQIFSYSLPTRNMNTLEKCIFILSEGGKSGAEVLRAFSRSQIRDYFTARSAECDVISGLPGGDFQRILAGDIFGFYKDNSTYASVVLEDWNAMLVGRGLIRFTKMLSEKNNYVAKPSESDEGFWEYSLATDDHDNPDGGALWALHRSLWFSHTSEKEQANICYYVFVDNDTGAIEVLCIDSVRQVKEFLNDMKEKEKQSIFYLNRENYLDIEEHMLSVAQAHLPDESAGHSLVMSGPDMFYIANGLILRHAELAGQRPRLIVLCPEDLSQGFNNCSILVSSKTGKKIFSEKS